LSLVDDRLPFFPYTPLPFVIANPALAISVRSTRAAGIGDPKISTRRCDRK